MVECHIGVCEYHVCHTDIDDGPFCSLGECVKATNEIIEMGKQIWGDDYGDPSDEGYEARATP